MGHESSIQMAELLKGEPSTLQTKGLIMLAQNQDKNFNSVDKRFENVESKLDRIIVMIQENKVSTDKRIEILKKEIALTLTERSAANEERFKKVEDATESITFYAKNPKALKVVGVAILIVIAYLVGHSELINKFL